MAELEELREAVGELEYNTSAEHRLYSVVVALKYAAHTISELLTDQTARISELEDRARNHYHRSTDGESYLP